MKHYKSQIVSIAQGNALTAAGGVVMVTAAGACTKVALKDSDGDALANPLALTNGSFDFYVADTVQSVDLYIHTASGHFVVQKGVKPSGNSSIPVDNTIAHTVMSIPFAAADQAGDATETTTGFTINGVVLPGVGLEITTVDATETVDIGTATADSGDPDGFLDGVSVATAGFVKGTNASGAVTIGALLLVAAAGSTSTPEASVAANGKEVVYTLSAGADTAAGFIQIPVLLPSATL